MSDSLKLGGGNFLCTFQTFRCIIFKWLLLPVLIKLQPNFMERVAISREYRLLFGVGGGGGDLPQ